MESNNLTLQQIEASLVLSKNNINNAIENFKAFPEMAKADLITECMELINLFEPRAVLRCPL